MTPEELQKLKDGIAEAVDVGSTVATLIVPQYAAFIALGKALAVLAPELYDDIVKLLSKEEPTTEEVDQLKANIQKLLNPEQFYNE